MLSKNQIKFITQLKQKKYRTQQNCFVAEGIKTIGELVNSRFELQNLYTTKTLGIDCGDQKVISEQELRKISFLTTPNVALAVFKVPKPAKIKDQSLIVALDNVRDPGNLGTIIRLCDWFGIEDLVCSLETVDCFNPKVVQATMGSISRVNISYVDLAKFVEESKTIVFGTFMYGDNVYEKELPKQGVLVLGNEANGISEAIEALVNERIAIPRFGKLQATESLNVATATAILLSEFKR